MRVIVCGGRDFNELGYLVNCLDRIHASTPITAIISGGARGADTLGEFWAKTRSIPVVQFPAQWHEHGKAAGFRRNEQMARQGKADLVVAFPGGVGTRHMRETAARFNIKVHVA